MIILLRQRSVPCCLAIGLLGLFTTKSVAQSEMHRHKSLRLNAGLSRVAAKDLSLSPLLYTGTGLKVGVGYEWGKRESRNNGLSVHYRGGALSNPVFAQPRISVNNVAVRYHHLRQVGSSGLRIGGVSSVFFYFKTYLIERSNNPNSFDAGANVGLAAEYNFRRFNKKWSVTLGGQLPVMAYYMRPTYGVPFPPEFLTEEYYTPYLEASTVLAALPASGEVVSFDTYFEIRTYVTLTRSLTDMFDELRLRYQWNYMQYRSLESSYHAEQLFSVGLVKYLNNHSRHEK